MKRLKRIILVQFFLYDAVELAIDGHTAFLGDNGAGKTALLDAIQIAMLGGHGSYLAFNTQSAGSSGGGRRSPRSIRDYCLGTIDKSGESNGRLDRKRDAATTYITLVFEDEVSGEPLSIGISIAANAVDGDHEVTGRYVLPGFGLTLADHIERGEAEDTPLLWSDFAAAIRDQGRRLGRTPSFEKAPMEYIREMLHALQPKARSIDVREYLSVFNKSVLLRNIESVDEFVRDYVVEPQAINREVARQQIDQFRELSAMLTQVQERIQALIRLDLGYSRVQENSLRADSMEALRLRIAAEDATHARTSNNNEMQTKRRHLWLLSVARDNLTNTVAATKQAFEEARELHDRNPSAERLASLTALRDVSVKTLNATRRQIEGDLPGIGLILEGLATHHPIPELAPEAEALHSRLTLAASRLGSGATESLGDTLRNSLQFLERTAPKLGSAAKDAQERVATASSDLTALTGLSRNVEGGGPPISKSVGHIIEILRGHGITATPVCNLVEVTDTRWQAAIETFLKSNREALVIADGREKEAVRILRGLPARDNPFAAKVIQPGHLRNERWNSADASLVGNLLIGHNSVGLAYLRALLGSMRQVDTEEELERYPRALTIDGMLSANFTTSRLQLYAPEDLRFGRRLDESALNRLHRQMEDAIAQHRNVEREFQTLQQMVTAINRLGDLARLRERLLQNADEAARAAGDAARYSSLLTEIDEAEIIPLREAQTNAEGAYQTAIQELSDNSAETKQARGEFLKLWQDRVPLRSRMIARGTDFKAYAASHETDASLMERVHNELSTNAPRLSTEEKLRSCELRRNNGQRDMDRAKDEVVPLLTRYLDGYGISLHAEQRDWRLALDWVRSERKRLEETELHKHQEDVERARRAAEEAFRNDIAVRMKESIERMSVTLKELNRTLTACPAFSNGEKYRFEWKPTDTHKDLYQYIISVGRGGDMYAAESDIHETVMNLLDDTDADLKSNPLDDYRRMFVFDLMIERPGRKATPLSRRIGVGSNGEHRTPFYMIAGAALAAAYRIDGGRGGDGTGLMLLDEAFDGMDAGNSLAAARFLDSIGLQLVMAAPADAFSKLAPAVDTMFDLVRYDDFFILTEPTNIKGAAHELLTSDLPSEHPELLARTVELFEGSSS
jgi:chromosome segregation protein